MASDIGVTRRGDSVRHGRASSDVAQRGASNGQGWIPIALGTAAALAGLGSRKKGTALALGALAGVAAAAALRLTQRNGRPADTTGHGHASGEREVERSITIGKTADELRRAWLDVATMPQIMGTFATVQATGNGRMHWKLDGPLGRTFEWDSEAVNDGADERIGWRSLPGAAISNEGSVRFRPAPPGRGTEATLHLRFARPDGALGGAALKLLGTRPLDLAADGALRRFKSLVETGEIPTTERQPAARADTR